jgi:hypothetical protein
MTASSNRLVYIYNRLDLPPHRLDRYLVIHGQKVYFQLEHVFAAGMTTRS